MKGAPIRFVAAVLGGWVCVRIAVLLPEVGQLNLAGDVLTPPAAAKGRAAASGVAAAPLGFQEQTRTKSWPVEAVPWLRLPARAATQNVPANSLVQSPTMPDRPPDQADQVAAPPILVPAILGPLPVYAPESRWAASAWMLARGGADGTLSGGQLGASQAGARITYRLSRMHRVALAGRLATPLRGRGTEAAIGLDWQPTAAPVHLVVEQRIAIDGARGGPTAMVIAGLNPTPIAAGFRLEAYAQGGAILRGGEAEAFGDGAARLTRPVASIGGAKLDLGVGIWAAGQRGARRIDVGPTLGVALPLAGRSVRVSIDWRQRVAGDTRPGSGPALSIGSDF